MVMLGNGQMGMRGVEGLHARVQQLSPAVIGLSSRVASSTAQWELVTGTSSCAFDPRAINRSA